MLPVNREDMDERGWEECDFIFVSGDAYVDHPSFAASLLCRVLEAEPAAECSDNYRDSGLDSRQ
ncbi:MAG: hypothetical protein FWC06_08945, partial [Treponema sp.]|nr:hypothetical protein [Treponema sp.]